MKTFFIEKSHKPEIKYAFQKFFQTIVVNWFKIAVSNCLICSINWSATRYHFELNFVLIFGFDLFTTQCSRIKPLGRLAFGTAVTGAAANDDNKHHDEYNDVPFRLLIRWILKKERIRKRIYKNRSSRYTYENKEFEYHLGRDFGNFEMRSGSSVSGDDSVNFF